MRSSNLNKKRREYLNTETFVSTMMTQFQNNEISRMGYVQKIGCC